MPGMYLGNSSVFGNAFGKPPMPGPPQTGTPPIEGQQPGIGGMVPGSPPTSATTNPMPGKFNPPTPITSTPPAQPPVQPWGANTAAPTAVRATGPTQGFDPSYLQNLATAIGGLFSNPQGGNTMNINPLGNLSEISPPSGQEGNAPQPGLPQTWLQQALAGLGFSFGPPPPAATSVTPTAPTVGSVGGGNTSGGRRMNLQ
jgi:hypothetical protein